MALWKPALVMFAYAAAVLMIGIATAAAAPVGANTITAIAIPAGTALLSAACGVLTLMMERKRLLGMIGIHVGLIVPLLVVVGTGMRLGGSYEKTGEANNSIAAIESQLAEPGSRAVIERSRTGAVTEQGMQQAEAAVIVSQQDALRPRGYQAVGLASIAALSGFAFVTLLLHRPKVPKAGLVEDERREMEAH